MNTVGFLFDNDGVLIDSREQHWLAWQRAAQELDLPIDYATFLKGFGKTNDSFLKDVRPTSTEEERRAWADRKELLFRDLSKNSIKLLPGMQAFLESLKQKNVPRIIASSGTVANLNMFLEYSDLGNYFNQFISGEEVAHGKPAPDIFIEAAHRLGLNTDHCIVLEDSPMGLEAGRRAGCFVIAFATTHDKDQLADYDLIYDSPETLNLDEVFAAFLLWKSKKGALVRQASQVKKRRILRKICGGILLSIGLIGIFIPVIPGALFIIGGAYLLESKFINGIIFKVRSTFKNIWQKSLDRLRHK